MAAARASGPPGCFWLDGENQGRLQGCPTRLEQGIQRQGCRAEGTGHSRGKALGSYIRQRCGRLSGLSRAQQTRPSLL